MANESANNTTLVNLLSSKKRETKEFQSLGHVRELFLAPRECALQFSNCADWSKLEPLFRGLAE